MCSADRFSSAPVGRSDLLKWEIALEKESLPYVAEFAGYASAQKIRQREQASRPEASPSEKVRFKPEKIEQKQSAESTEFLFWHATSFERKEIPPELQTEPAWYRDAQKYKDGDKNCRADRNRKPPKHLDLIKWSRLWPFLRRSLGCVYESKAIDIQKLVDLISSAIPVKRFPRRKKLAWAKRSQIIIDRNLRLIPVWDDMRLLVTRLRKLRGDFGLLIRWIKGNPFEEKDDCLPVEPGIPILILSDLGLFEQSGNLKRAWLEFGEEAAKNSHRCTVLMPASSRDWSLDCLKFFRLASWDRGSRLSDAQSFFSGKAGSSENAGECEQAMMNEILTLLAPAVRIEHQLLRAVRYDILKKRQEIGVEIRLLSHPHVQPGVMGFDFNPDFAWDYKEEFRALEKEIRDRALNLIKKYHSTLSPAIWAEEKFAYDLLLNSPDISTEYYFADIAKTLRSEGFNDKRSLREWVNRVASRIPADIWVKNEKFVAAFIISNQDEIRMGGKFDAEGEIQAAGITLHEKIDPANVAWMLLKRPANYHVTQIGEQFLIQDEASFVRSTDATIPEQGSPLGVLHSDYSLLRIAEADSKQRIISGEWILSCSRAIPIDFPREGSIEIGTEQEELRIQSNPKFGFSKSTGCDENGLFVEIEDARAGEKARKRLYWFPPGRYEVMDSSSQTEFIIIMKGFWWDEAEFMQWKERGFEKPSWAEAFGKDEYGIYADFAVKGIIQRMRWILPGRFMMGSSEETDPIREDNEIHHEVMLTKAFWLADSACTQDLWEIAMGKNPSGFKGTDRPVENVSWKDTMMFIEKLNKMIPGLGVRMPTEAEWEYACRAGTQTPFSFGVNITPDQVNYFGDPYKGEKKGKFRKETVAVKSLPCNAWGLFEMHGNVWEWCSDWYAKYAGDDLIDPIGSYKGSARVLRGGAWLRNAGYVRSAYRYRSVPGNRGSSAGFRLARGHIEAERKETGEGSHDGQAAKDERRSVMARRKRKI